MKKLTVLLCTLALLCSFCLPVFADSTVKITTTVPGTHTITVEQANGVAVTCNGRSGTTFTVERLSQPQLRFSPDSGRVLSRVLVNGADITALMQDGCYTLPAVYEDLTLQVETTAAPQTTTPPAQSPARPTSTPAPTQSPALPASTPAPTQSAASPTKTPAAAKPEASPTATPQPTTPAETSAPAAPEATPTATPQPTAPAVTPAQQTARVTPLVWLIPLVLFIIVLLVLLWRKKGKE